MLTKEEAINKVNALMREACRYWAVLDGLAGNETIKAEQQRIKQEGNAVIEYIKNHA